MSSGSNLSPATPFQSSSTCLSTSSFQSISPSKAPTPSSMLTMSSSSTQVQSTVKSSASKRAQVIFNHIKLSSIRDGPFALKPNKTVESNFPLNMEISSNNDSDNSCESTSLVIRTGSSKDSRINQDKVDQVSSSQGASEVTP